MIAFSGGGESLAPEMGKGENWRMGQIKGNGWFDPTLW